jgi:hypothetical protein
VRRPRILWPSLAFALGCAPLPPKPPLPEFHAVAHGAENFVGCWSIVTTLWDSNGAGLVDSSALVRLDSIVVAVTTSGNLVVFAAASLAGVKAKGPLIWSVRDDTLTILIPIYHGWRFAVGRDTLQGNLVLFSDDLRGPNMGRTRVGDAVAQRVGC